jgi:nicotinamide-nucleotide amidase
VATSGARGDVKSGALEIVTIGTELLLGATLDRNASWLGRELAASGIAVTRRVTVGDNENAIRSAVGDALKRSGAVICTGGLGPTRDDLTKQAVAALLGRELIVHDGWLATIRERFEARGLRMPEVNRVQAEVPQGALLLPNERGTAPGIIVEEGDDVAILLPGVPSEMRWLTARYVLPYLAERGFMRDSPVISRTVRTTGIAESALAERIDDLVAELAPLTLAYLPTGIGEDLRITSWGELPLAEATARLERAMASFTARLAPWVYGTSDDDLATVVGQELRERGLTLAIAESCTGGLIAKRLTDAAGASDFLSSAVVSYSNESKRDLLGVSDETLREHGAVSEAIAREMAQGVRNVTGAMCGLSVTGIAGPGGGTTDKPVGTVWVAAAVADRVEAKLLRLFGDRAEIRERAAQAALAFLRELLRREAA